ncbi:sulfotransferase domain-containing protein [Candidatus Pelagibacter sp.]|nr:sulfotransferase domain-containing protein [Candidatus Pelagibacter sp.]
MGSSPIARSIVSFFMIIWIASYPKSGNTYLRSFISSYYFSKKGKFQFDLLLNILQFPSIKFTKNNVYSELEASQNWLYNQNQFFDKDKIHFVKTHNCLSEYKNNKFTTHNETLGAIYIVRDPRNVITSIKHHYMLDYDKAYSKMMDKNCSILEKSVDQDFSNFTYLSSWSNHYKSWKSCKEFEILFLKYEDLENNKIETFRKIILFINKLQNKEVIINEDKFRNSIKSTNFANLKNKETVEGFFEAAFSKEKGKKINFFNLGFNNRWQKILPVEFLQKLNTNLRDDLIELGYNINNE